MLPARRTIAALTVAGLLAGCSVATGPQHNHSRPGGPQQQRSTGRPVDPALAERLQR